MIEAAGLGQIAGLRHGFFTREGGYSQGLYSSLNCGLGSGDDLAAVRRNRKAVAATLGAEPGNLLSVFQVHSNTVIQATEPWDANARPRADAIVTRRPGMAIAILTADCAPVLMADTTVGIVGAAHAGWKGAIGRVLESTIDEMERLGGHRRHIVAAIGPAIGQAAYEVGQEFYDRFLTSEPGNTRFFIAQRPAAPLPLRSPGLLRLPARSPGPPAGRDRQGLHLHRRAALLQLSPCHPSRRDRLWPPDLGGDARLTAPEQKGGRIGIAFRQGGVSRPHRQGHPRACQGQAGRAPDVQSGYLGLLDLE